MPSRQELYSTLAKARQELQHAQLRVAELEAQLVEDQPKHSAPEVSDNPYHDPLGALLAGCQIIGFDWRYRYINDAAAYYERRTKEEFLGHTILELHPGIEKTPLFAVLQRCMLERSVERIEHEVMYPDGDSAWYELLVQPVPEGIFILSLDITERKQTELALLEREQQFKLFVEHAPAALAILDNEMRYLLVSRRWLTDYRVRETNVIGRSHYDLFPDLPAQWKEIHQRCLAGAVEHSEADPFPRADGSFDWVRWEIHPWRKLDGTIGGILILSKVIIGVAEQDPQRQQAEAAVKRYTQRMEILHQIDREIINANSTEEIVETALKHTQHVVRLEQTVAERTIDLQSALGRVKAILNNSPDAILLVDADLTIRQTNQPFSTLFSGAWEQALGQSLLTLIHPDDIHAINNLPQVAATQQPGNHLEVRAIRKNGTTFDAELSIGSIEGDGLVCMIRDITERKAQERQLRYHASLQESVSDAVIVIDMANNVQSWNKAAEGIYGWSAAEAVGQPGAKFLHYEVSPEQHARDMRHLQEYGWLRGEIRQFHKDGRLIYVWSSITLIKDEQGKPLSFIAVNHDITERKSHERQLRYHASIQESVSDAVIATDMEFLIQSWNRAAELIYGWRAGEAIGRSVSEILQTTYASSAAGERILRDFFEHGAWQGEVIQHHRDGRQIYIHASVNLFKDETGQPIGVVSVNRDITERKQAEVELREAEHLYHALFEQAHDAVFWLDMQGNHIKCNQRAAEMLGYTIEELHTLSFRELSDEVSQSERVLTRLLAGESVPMYERIMRKRDGSRIAVEINVEIVRDLAGHPHHIQSVLRDITARKRAEESLRESEERFRRAILDAPFPIMIHADSGEVLHISNVWTEISGYTHAEIPTMTDWIEKAYRENSQTARPLIEKVYTLTKPRRGGEFRIWTKAGEERIWDFISAPLGAMPDGRRMVSSMAMDITERKQAEEALQTKMAEERQFQIYLKALHEIIIELTGIEQLDTFYQRAVELGRKRLGFERLAIFLYDPQDDSAVGTYGTDIQGNLVDERGVRFTPDPNGVMHRSFDRVERFYFNAETTLYHDEVAVGYGWNVAAVLYNGTRSLGWFVADNLLSHLPASKSLLDIIGLYALSVGTLLAQKQTQLALKESEALYRLLAENISDLIMRSTLTSECLYISPSVQTLLGYTPEELSGQQTFSLIHPDDQAIIWEAYASALARKDLILPHQYRARHKAGHYIWLETVGKPLFSEESNEVLGVITSSRDITKRKQVEEAVRESEARYRLLAENLADIIMTFSPDRQIIYMSSSCEKFLGYLPEEIEGKSHSEFIHPEDYPQVSARTHQAVVAKEHSYTNQFRIRHKAGHYIWYEVRTRVVWEHNPGNVVQFVSVLRDITERKQAEDALRESEEKFRLLLDAAPVATIISDQAGRVSLVNRQAETLLGYGRSELTGQLVELLVPDYARSNHVNNRTTYLAAPRVRPMGLGMELYARRKDGSEVPVEIELSYIDTRDGMMVMSFIIDITERKRVAAELEQQRSFLRNVIDVSPSMIFVKDYNGRFVLVNPSVATIYNTTIDALIGKTDADFNPTRQEVADFLAADRMVIASGNMLFVEEPLTSPTGKVYWLQTTKVPIVSADGQSKYVLGVSTDITERKEAEEALRTSEAKYRFLVETMRGGLAVLDTAFRVTFVNDRFCELLGYSSAEVIGKQPMSFVDPADMPLVQSHLERRQSAESTSYELPLRHKDGHQIYMLMSGSPLLDKQGNYNGSLVVATDITIQKQAEAALRQALAKEKELGDLKTRFVSMASHEFRTPLASILALVETVSAYRNKLSEEQIEQRLNKIKAQIEHLKNIMEDILMLSRMQARHVEFKPVPLDLDALSRSILDEFQSQAASKHRLEYTVSEGRRAVMLDGKLMRQLISNLVSNAIKYSPQGTVVRIHLEYTDSEVILKVSDEGIGIPEADLPHLFEPFHRAANVGTISGTGLGLVITQEAVDLHGGTITVESQLGVGSTFLVRIPISTGGGEKNDEHPAGRDTESMTRQ